MAIKIGINGFGRIGRLVLRIAAENPDLYEIVGINDPFIAADYMAYMIQYDTVHGRFCGTAELADGKLTVNGKTIETYGFQTPAEIPWSTCGAEYVVDSTGVFNTTETSSVGTRKDIPVSLPFSSGMTKAHALAAPVEEGIMFPKAARPPRQSFLEGASTVFWVPVTACTVVIRPSSMPKLS